MLLLVGIVQHQSSIVSLVIKVGVLWKLESMLNPLHQFRSQSEIAT